MRVLETIRVQIGWDDIQKMHDHGRFPAAPRTDGAHLSAILRSIALRTGLIKDLAEEDTEIMPLRMALGMAWEAWAAGLYPQMTWQPGELERDGIYATPDGLSLYREADPATGRALFEAPMVEEFKLTWKSASRPIEGEWIWLRQCMGYCAVLEADLARLHVCHVNGNYQDVREPVYLRHLVRFTRQEIEQCWSMLLKNKEAGR